MKENKCFTSLLLIFQIVFYILIFALLGKYKIYDLEKYFIANITMDLVAIPIAWLLFFYCYINLNKNLTDYLFMGLIFIESLTLFSDAVSWIVQGKPNLSSLNVLSNCFFYCGGLLLPMFSWLYQVDVMKLQSRITKILTRVVFVTGGSGVLLLILNIFLGFYFSVDFSTGLYTRNRYFYVSEIPPIIIGLISLYYVITRKSEWRIKLPFVVFNLIPYACSVIQLFTFGISFLYIGVLIAIILIFVNIQVEIRRDLDNAKTQLMVSQIQPHFIFNSLATIEALCHSDAEKAGDTIQKFSKYLRGNIAALDGLYVVPFEKEIEHVKVYAEIEQLRFENIKIEYDLKSVDFMLPFLTIQPLVENSIRHGVRIREKGIVKIESYKTEKFNVIVISDNGKGFDVNLKENTKDGVHVGLKNVEHRIKNISNGQMIIESKIDEGTKITIRIPINK